MNKLIMKNLAQQTQTELDILTVHDAFVSIKHLITVHSDVSIDFKLYIDNVEYNYVNKEFRLVHRELPCVDVIMEYE